MVDRGNAFAPRSISTAHSYDRDELDPARHHAALLGLANELGARLREERSITQALTLTVTYADRTSTTCARTLTETTAHTAQLAHTALDLLGLLGLQRARVRTISLRAERLLPAEQAVRQLTSTPTTTKPMPLKPPSTAPTPAIDLASPEPQPPTARADGGARRHRTLSKESTAVTWAHLAGMGHDGALRARHQRTPPTR